MPEMDGRKTLRKYDTEDQCICKTTNDEILFYVITHWYIPHTINYLE